MKSIIIGLLFLIILSGCTGTTVETGPSVDLGVVAVSLHVNEQGDLIANGQIAIPIALGIVSWDVAFSTVLYSSGDKSNYLIILWDDGTGNIMENDYPIGQPFDITFEHDQWVRRFKRTENGNIVVFVEKQELIDFEPPTPAVNLCPYQGNSDKETFEKLMRAEQMAALTEDLGMLDEIFLPGTLLTDPSGVTSSVVEHYQKKFSDVDFIELNLYEIEIVKIDDTSAWVTQSATGSFVITESGQRIDYEIKPSDGHAVFRRDSNGCWKMSS